MQDATKKPVISVIVCCYNPDFIALKNTVTSIAKQEGVDFEIIITDDGSKTQYKSELEAFISERGYENVIYNFLPQNVGTVKNILSAVNLSNGKYVKTISPGDYLYDKYVLKKYVDTFNSTNADIVYTGLCAYDINYNEIINICGPQRKRAWTLNGIKKALAIDHDYITGATVAAKKEIEVLYLDKVKDYVKYTEDVALTLLAVLDGKKIVAIKEPFVYYEYGSGISTQGAFNPLITKDLDGFYLELSKNKDRLSKKSAKIYFVEKMNFGMKKNIKLFFTSPRSFIYRFILHFKKTKPIGKIDVEKMNQMINP